MVLRSQLNLLCEIVDELGTLGSVACTEGYVPSIKVKESHGKQLDRIAQELCIADGQTLLDFLCSGKLFVFLKSNKRTDIQPAVLPVQPKRPRGNKDRKYRLKLAAKKAAAAGGNADENSNEEGSSGTTTPAVEQVELVAPKPRTKLVAPRTVRRDAQRQREYEAAKALRDAAAQAQAPDTPGSTPNSSHTRTSEENPTGPNGDDVAAVKKRSGPKRKPDERVGQRQLQRRKAAAKNSTEVPEIRPKKVRAVTIGIRQASKEVKEGLEFSFMRVLSQNDRRSSSKRVVTRALLMKRLLSCSKGGVASHKEIVAALPRNVVQKIRKGAVEEFKLKMRHPGHFAEAKTRAGVSFTQIDNFFRYMLPGEKRVKPGRQTVVNARNAVADIMQVLNPLAVTAGKDGYGHTVDKFFQLLLPPYFDRVARAMFADGDKNVRIFYPEDESTAEDEPTEQQVITIRFTSNI
jgi:hypothetical protein